MFKLASTDNWDNACRELKAKLSYADEQVLIFPNFERALFEVAFGLHLTFGHKKKILIGEGLGNHLYNLSKRLFKSGMKSVAWSNEAISENLTDILMSITDVSNPITSEKFPHADLLEGRKFYQVYLHHNEHLRDSAAVKVGKREAHIFRDPSGMAIAILGSKFSFTSISVAHESHIYDLTKLEYNVGVVENESWVKEFELSGWAGCKPWLRPSIERYYDRAVVYWEDLNGEAIAVNLRQALGCSVELVKPLSYCENQGYQQKFFPDQVDQIRGLVVFSSDLCQNKDFKSALNATIGQLRASGTF